MVEEGAWYLPPLNRSRRAREGPPGIEAISCFWTSLRKSSLNCALRVRSSASGARVMNSSFGAISPGCIGDWRLRALPVGMYLRLRAAPAASLPHEAATRVDWRARCRPAQGARHRRC